MTQTKHRGPGVPVIDITDDHGTSRTYRRCSRCRSFLEQRTYNFSARKRDGKGGPVTRWDSFCLACRRAAAKARRDAMTPEARRAESRRKWEAIKADPKAWDRRREENRANHQRWRDRDPEHARAISRKHYHLRKQDPERYASYLESRRMEHRLRRERDQGVNVVDIRGQRRPQVRTQDDTLPSAPLAAAVLASAVRRALGNPWDSTGATTVGRERVCALAEVNPRQLYRWETAEAPRVTFDVADRVVTRLELSWWTVWAPENDLDAYEEARRLFEGDDRQAVAS